MGRVKYNRLSKMDGAEGIRRYLGAFLENGDLELIQFCLILLEGRGREGGREGRERERIQ